jgi:hypothetical protein
MLQIFLYNFNFNFYSLTVNSNYVYVYKTYKNTRWVHIELKCNSRTNTSVGTSHNHTDGETPSITVE